MGGLRTPAVLALLLVSLFAFALLVAAGTRLSFFSDDWYYLLQRPGWSADALLVSHNGHLSLLPVLVTKSLVEVFGLTSQVPFRAALAGAVVGLGLVVHRWVADCSGAMVGVAAAALVMLLGTAWEDLLVPTTISFVGSLGLGLGALLALRRDTPRRNAVACGLLVLSVLSANLGLAAATGAVVAVAVRRRPVQAWIPLAPMLVFGAWYLLYGDDRGYSGTAAGTVSADNLLDLPAYVAKAAASAAASLVGLNRPERFSPYLAGAVVLAALAVGLVFVLRRTGRPSAAVLAPAAMLVAFWVLTGLGYKPGREPEVSRYQLVNVALLVVIGAELTRGLRLRRPANVALAAVATLSLLSQLDALRDGYRFMRVQAAYAKAATGALELARPQLRGDVQLLDPPAGSPHLSGVTARRYFTETDAHGSPGAWAPAELAAAPPDVRRAVDGILTTAYRAVTPVRPAPPAAGCRPLPAGREMRLAPGSVVLTGAESTLVVRLRRFAPAGTTVPVAFLSPEGGARVRVPRDAAAQPWWLTVTGGPARVCPV